MKLLAEHLGPDRPGGIARGVDPGQQINQSGAEIAPVHVLTEDRALPEVRPHAQSPDVVGIVVALGVVKLAVDVDLVGLAAASSRGKMAAAPAAALA